MRIVKKGEKTYRLPSHLNAFQEELYTHLIDWKRVHIGEVAGTHRGEVYDAILPDDLAAQRLILYPAIRDALSTHLRRFPFKIHKFFNHMASSQAANINLFLPILQNPQTASILGVIKPDFAQLATDRLDGGYRIEFWDEPYNILGDKTPISGTDSDLGIAYYNHAGDLCLWLIEHKLSENEFTECGGYKSNGRQDRHDCGKSFAELVVAPSACYYHDVNQYQYWQVTAAHRDFFPNHAAHVSCPFRGGMNQLWRNMLLALAIEQDDRQPYKQVTFSVVRHPRNTSLDATLAGFRALIDNNPKFSVFTSADVITAATAHADATLGAWIRWYVELYDL